MKITILSDSHLKNKKQTPERFEAIESVISYCNQKKIYHIFFAGDTFDDNLENYSDFDDLANRFKNLNFWLLRGNHDDNLSQHNFLANNIRVIEHPTLETIYNKEFFLIPYAAKKYAADFIQILIQNLSPISENKILISHCDYISIKSDINEYEQSVYMPLFRKDIEFFDKVFLGHIHKSQIIDNKVYYCGSSYPIASDELGERYFLVFDCEFDKVDKIPILTKEIFFSANIVLNPLQNIEEILKQTYAILPSEISARTSKQSVILNAFLYGLTLNKKEACQEIEKFFNVKKIKVNIDVKNLKIIDHNNINQFEEFFTIVDECKKKLDLLNLSSRLRISDKDKIFAKVIEAIGEVIKT